MRLSGMRRAWTPKRRTASIAGAAVAMALAGVSMQDAAPARAAGSCTMTENLFRISHVTLTETLTGHFVDTDDGHAHSTIDLVQRGNLSSALPGPSAADKRKYRNVADYYELISGCRVGDLNLGWLNRTLAVPYSVSGTWTTSGRTGQCTQGQTLNPVLDGTFMRPTKSRKFYPPPARSALALRLVHHGRVDCRYQYPSDTGTGYETSGLGSYIEPAYDDLRIIIPTATMVNRRVVTIPFHFQKTINHSWWWHGNVDWQATASGSLTLTRYKQCRFTPQTPIGAYCKL